MSFDGPVAQWIEQGTPKPLVGGSIPSGPASRASDLFVETLGFGADPPHGKTRGFGALPLLSICCQEGDIRASTSGLPKE